LPNVLVALGGQSLSAAIAEQRLFDIAGARTYLQGIGATSATLNFVRNLISSGQVPHIRIGKKFYVSRAALDSWLISRERRAG
jgi:excisionase family DNA binding protein